MRCQRKHTAWACPIGTVVQGYPSIDDLSTAANKLKPIHLEGTIGSQLAFTAPKIKNKEKKRITK